MSMVDPKALFTFSYGLYIVSTSWDDKLNGQVANAVMQLTAEPICIAACLNKNNYTTELLTQSKKFSVTVFSEDATLPFIGIFGFHGGREYDKFSNCAYRMTELGLPIVTEHTLAAVEASVINVVDVHTHLVFVGEVLSASVLTEGKPLTYADYHNLKKGKSPATAPTSIFNKI